MEPRGGISARSPAPTVHEPAGSEIPVNVPSKPKRNGTNGQPGTNGRGDSPSTADEVTGIPGYFIVEPNVATGGQPTLEGMKWLKDRGFHTVLNLLPESESDPAEASMVRQLGLEYITIPITAQMPICVKPNPLKPRIFPAIKSLGEQDDRRTSTTRFDFSSRMLRTSSCPDVITRNISIIIKM